MPYIKHMKQIPDIALTEYRQAAAGNYSPGRSMNGEGYDDTQTQPDLIVIHVADGTYGGTLSWFGNPDAPASAHFTVGIDGRLGQSVYERDTAFHSGRWSYNVRSFGIEHEGQPSKGPWEPTEKMYRTSARLSAYLCYKYGIPADRQHIIGHSEVDPNRAARRNCPGPTWNWSKYINMVKQEVAALEKVYTEQLPGHEKDDYDRPITLVNKGGDKQVGSGTLVAGTDKVYVKNISLTQVAIGAPSVKEYRKVRLFNGKTNKVVGSGIYIPDTNKVYIVELGWTD